MLNQPPHISKLIMPATNPNTSRLRKSGLTRNVAAVVVATSSALVTAEAAIVYSGVVNITADASVTNPANISVNLDSAGAAEFTLTSSLFNKSSFVNNFLNGFKPIADSTTGGKVTKLTLGSPVDATGVFSTASSQAGNGYFFFSGDPTFGEWAGTDTGYMGFTFNPTGSTPLYGWGRITNSSNTSSVTLVDYAYQDNGSSISTGAVPEPTTAVLGALGVGAFLFRRRSRGTTEA